MNKRLKRDLILIAFGVCLFAALNNISVVVLFIKKLLSLCLPVVLGFLLAFILNAPMRGFEGLIDKICAKFGKTMPSRVKYPISLILSIFVILLAFVIVFTIAIPKITESVMSIVKIINNKIPQFLIFLEENGIDTTFITEKLAEFNLEEPLKKLSQGAFTIVVTAVDATVLAVKFFSSALFACIIAIYMLLDKNNLSRQTKKLTYALLPETKANYIYRTAYLIRDTFSKFLSGQCLEAIILAALIFILFTIFKLPYASLIAMLAAVLSFIPYVGSFIACAIGVFLTLIVSPGKALICIAVYLLAQFVEQHFIYPHVVGNSVGLSPFFTIVAVLLGGNLFGVWGMVFFIPIFSVIYTLVKDAITAKKKKLIQKPNKNLD